MSNGYVFTGLDPGVHTIEIYDSNNCANSYAFTVTEPSPMQLQCQQIIIIIIKFCVMVI